MCENILYRTRKIRKVYGRDKVLVSDVDYKLRYGIPKEANYLIKDWKELLLDMSYVEEYNGRKDKKGRIYSEIDYTYVEFLGKKRWKDIWLPERLYKEDFSYAEIIYEHNICQYNRVNMRDILEELNMEELILFFKDNEINYLPNLK